MPFGLKNVDPTYQHLMDKLFKELRNDIMEEYIDDMVIKSSKTKDHFTHL